MPKFMNVSLDETPHLLNVDCIQEVFSGGAKSTRVVMKQLESPTKDDEERSSFSRIDDYDIPILEFVRRMMNDLLEI